MNLVLALGIMIIAGFFGGMLAHRLKFPRITGYIIVGVLLSPSLLNIVSGTTIDDLDVFTSIALGIIAYSIGGSLHWESIKKLEKSIFLIAPFQSIGAFILSILVITFLAPLFLDIPGATVISVYFPMAFVIGAMASATSPATTLALVREYRAEGPLTTTLLSVVALDDAIAILLFSIALGLAQPLAGSTQGLSLSQALLLPLLEILESVAIGAVLGLALTYIARWVKTRALLLAVVLGTVLLCVGITELLAVSGIMANMVVGFIVVNRLKRGEMFLVIDDIEDVIFALFFVLAGLHFDLGVMQTAGILALLIVVSRFAGKYLGTRAGATIAGAPEPVRKYLGLALMPKAGVTLGLALLAQRAFPTFGDIIFNAILVSVIINELFAPFLVRYAIFKAGEQRRG